MPRISQFFGIVITMYFNDHPPAHFHAKYAEHEATIDIEALRVHEGRLPPRALAMVLEWTRAHQDELRADWMLARQRRPLNRIAPLE